MTPSPLPPAPRPRPPHRGISLLLLEQRREWRTTCTMAVLLVAAVVPGVVSPLLVQRLFDRALPAQDVDALLHSVTAIAGLTLLGYVLSWLHEMIAVAQRSRIRYRLARRLLRHLLHLPLTYYHRSDTRHLVTRVRDDVTALEGLLPGALLRAAVDLLRALVFLALLLFIDPGLALGGLALVASLSGGFALAAGSLRRSSRHTLDREATAGAALLDTLGGILTVRTTAQESREGRRVARSLAAAERSRVRRDLLSRTAMSGLGLVGVLGSYGVVALGAYRVMVGASTIGTLFSFFLFLTQLVSAAEGTLSVGPRWQRARAALDRIGELLREPAEPRRQVRRAGARRLHGAVELDAVSLRYGDGPRVLTEVSLTARPGEVVALVGPSGAGKSSLVRLVPRLLEPSAGEVRIDGRPARSYPLAQLRGAVGFVAQEMFLFNRSVRDNIAFAAGGADDEALRRAARQAHAEGFILELPDGYDTVVGERGVRLSGGQRQRLAIAREILRDPPILVLDEATSALDADSEAGVRRGLAALRGRRTLLVVAHRLSTVLAADRIVVLDAGRVRDSGPHDELYARCSLYRRLCDLQLVATGESHGRAGERSGGDQLAVTG